MRQFTVNVGGEELSDLEGRLRSARWLGGAHAEIPGFGTTVSATRRLCEYWLESFDWRALEARINRQPNHVAQIDGLDIHFIHRRSAREDAVPLILLHGWPTSFLEFLDVIDTLADPPGDAPAFHVIVPSLPGYGFSQTREGTSPRRIAELFAILMAELSYDRYIVQGGNWGASIGTEMAREWPERIIGLHLNCVNGSPPADAPALSDRDRAIADTYAGLLSSPHFNLCAQTPYAIAHALNDSPAGLAAWIAQWLERWADTELEGNPGLAPEWMVSTIALYWLTGSIGTASALYKEAVLDPAPERFVQVPTGVAHFEKENVMIPRPWAERHYNIVQWSEFPRGGHYPAVEVPDLFVGDLRQFAAALCQTGEAG